MLDTAITDGLAKIHQRIAETKLRTESAREQNRRDFPECARVVALLAEFAPRVIFAEEGGKFVGKEERLNWVTWVDTDMPKVRR